MHFPCLFCILFLRECHYLSLDYNELDKHQRRNCLHGVYYKFRWEILINVTNFLGIWNSVRMLYKTALLTKSYSFLKSMNNWCTVSLYSHFSSRNIWVTPPGLTTQMPMGQMPVARAQTMDQNTNRYTRTDFPECLSFENVENFKYLGVTVTNMNDIREEIKRRINMGNACYCSL